MRLSPLDFRLRRATAIFIAVFSLLSAGHRSTLAQESGSVDLPEGLTIHVVQMDESLAEIARTYDVPLAKLLTANDISTAASIHVGDRILVPGSVGSGRELYNEEYVVGEYDSLFTLAKLTSTDVMLLAEQVTAVNPYGLHVGQSLSMAPASRSYSGNRRDILKRTTPDESLLKIAVVNDLSIYEVATANNLSNPLIVPVGSLLRIPSSSSESFFGIAPWREISVNPHTVQTGRTVSIAINTSQPGTLAGHFLDQDVPFVTADTAHHTVIGVSRWQDPGVYPLDVTFTPEAGDAQAMTINLKVIDGGYVSESLRIPENIAAVLNDPQAVQAEIAYVASVMSGFTPDPLWSGSFLLPSTGVMTSAFGTLRSYNGSGFNTFHSGADLAARTGTPILAPADGVVVNIAELDVRGLVTMIDHGFGVYTGYWHQSSILVEPGDTVTTGQQIGTIGSTGLSTAAHLHWELWIRGTQVDAMQWIRESFP